MRRRGGGGEPGGYDATRKQVATAGGASSFGSYVSAPGGAAGLRTGVPPSQVNARSAITGFYTTVPYVGTSLAWLAAYIVSRGGMGWLPECFLPDPDYMQLARSLTPVNSNARAMLAHPYAVSTYFVCNASSSNRAMDIFGNEQAARTDKRGGRPYTTGYSHMSVGSTGIYLGLEAAQGYGAGGSGWYITGTGGNAGAVIRASVTLPNTSSIAVTVGNGGTGGCIYYSYSNYYDAYGGGGARGCVAVFW